MKAGATIGFSSWSIDTALTGSGYVTKPATYSFAGPRIFVVASF